MVRWAKGRLTPAVGRLTPVAVALALLCAPCSPEAQHPRGSQWRVLSEGPNHFEISLTVPPPKIMPAHIGKLDASRLELDGWISSSSEGAPMLPLRSIALAVPEGEEFEITVEGEEPVAFSGVLLVPFWPGSFRDSEADSVPARVVSNAVYGADVFLPRVLCEIGSPQYLRDLRLVPVDIRPARYNAGARELLVYTRLRIRLETRGPGQGAPRAPAPSAGELRGESMWEEIYKSAALNYPSEMALRALRTRRDVLPRSSGDYFSSSSRWLALKTASRGMYKIAYEDILASGVPKAELDSLDPATLRLFNGGGLPIDIGISVLASPSWMTECAILVEDGDDGGFGPGDKVIFYGLGAVGWSDHLSGRPSWGPHFENNHTDFNVYWLTWGGDFESGPPLRMASRDGEPGGEVAYAPQTYRERLHSEENLFWNPTPFEKGVKWERWWWQELAMTDPGGRVYSADLHDVDTSAPCRLKARFWGDEYVVGCLPHHILKLELNDRGPFLITGQGDYRMDVDTTAVWAVEGKNTMVAQVPFMVDDCLPSNQRRKDKSLFAWFELEYYRHFGAVEDELAFDWIEGEVGLTRFETHGFSTDNVRVFDVTDRYRPGVIRTSAISQGGVTFQENYEGPRRNYYLIAEAALRSPDEISLRSPGSLRASSAAPDYIVVTGRNLINAANVLADWRRSQLYGITSGGELAGVEVADVADIYDEFSWGMIDPLAIRGFLEFRFRSTPAGHRPPSYVLLLGDATWDFKNVYRLGVKNVVPAYVEGYDTQSRTQYSSDDFFVLFEGAEDRFADMAVGRITAETAGEAMDLVTRKIIGFERAAEPGPWRNTVLLAADDACKLGEPEGLGARHTAQAEDLSKLLPQALDRTKIFMIDYGGPGCLSVSKPDARKDFVDALDTGAILINYVGHGSENKLSDENLLLGDDVASLSNEGRMGLFITASCAVGKFDVPLEVGVAEGLVRHPSKGSLASYAATTLAYILPNKELNENLVRALLPRVSTVDSARVAPTRAIGLAVLQAEAAFTNWDYSTPYKYVLLGDPASVLTAPGMAYPRGGAWMWVDLEMSASSLAGGERDTLKGAVMADGLVATTFQGQASVLVQGRRVAKTLPRFADYFYAGPTFYRGVTKVVDGRFVLSWTNPHEVKTGEDGRIRAFVWSDREDAVGTLASLEIAPPTGPPTDKTGPEIELSFENAGVAVTPGAVLLIRVADPSGINLAPLLAENGLFLRLYNDDLGRLVDGPVDLGAGFTYEEGSSSSGRVSYRLPTGLPTEEGANAYRVEVSASDNFSNRTSSEMRFDLLPAEAQGLADVINFPNPFSSGTTISFRVMKQADVVVKVFTVGGRLVRTLESPGVTGWGHVEWDGRDQEGDEVANGVYLYKVTAVSTGAGRERVEAIGKATVIR